MEDVAAAFAWVNAHIAERGGDPTGAHLSLLLATDPRYRGAQGLAISKGEPHRARVEVAAPALLVAGWNDFPMLEVDARAFIGRAAKVGRNVEFLKGKGRITWGPPAASPIRPTPFAEGAGIPVTSWDLT